jgi:uncharacterized protein YoxC
MDITAILSTVTSILLAITGFLIVRWIKSVDDMQKTLSTFSENVAKLTTTVNVMEANSRNLVHSCTMKHDHIDKHLNHHDSLLEEHGKKIVRLETLIDDKE